MNPSAPPHSPTGDLAPAMTPAMQAALAQLALRVLPIWSRQLATARDQSEQAVGQLLKAFNAINPVLEQLIPEGGTTALSLQPDIEQMYVGLQYQDRISQMLGLVQDDMARLLQTLENPHQDPSELAVQEWLARLESLYAMAEQRRDHGHSGQDSGGGDDGTSFF